MAVRQRHPQLPSPADRKSIKEEKETLKMKLQFKYQKFQADAAKAVADVFDGQPYLAPSYMTGEISGKNEQITPFKTDNTTVSSFVYFSITGSVVSSLVAPAGAMHV